MSQLIRCVMCDAVFLKTPYDQSPEYTGAMTDEGRRVRILERDDLGDFLENHRGHRLEDLMIVEDSWVGEKEYGEPVHVSYLKATNGKEKFVIKRHRGRINDPLKYELIHGDYSLACVGVEIQSREITRELERVLRGKPALAQKIHAFVELFQHVSRQVDITGLERVPEESDHPLEVYHRIDDVSLFYLLRNCRTLFDQEGFPEIEAFIDRHKGDGVLLLKATYRIQIKEKTRSAEEASPAFLCLKKVSLGEKN
jgi:hypothetical protein